MMDNKPFEKPVVVELGHVGKYRHISSTREAAECLMTVWPLNRGERPGSVAMHTPSQHKRCI